MKTFEQYFADCGLKWSSGARDGRTNEEYINNKVEEVFAEYYNGNVAYIADQVFAETIGSNLSRNFIQIIDLEKLSKKYEVKVEEKNKNTQLLELLLVNILDPGNFTRWEVTFVYRLIEKLSKDPIYAKKMGIRLTKEQKMKSLFSEIDSMRLIKKIIEQDLEKLKVIVEELLSEKTNIKEELHTMIRMRVQNRMKELG